MFGDAASSCTAGQSRPGSTGATLEQCVPCVPFLLQRVLHLQRMGKGCSNLHVQYDPWARMECAFNCQSPIGISQCSHCPQPSLALRDLINHHHLVAQAV
jgi:hypothetical protein